MRVLFLFLDGIGLGRADPATNPFFKAEMPQVAELLGGYRLTTDSPLPLVTRQATLLALDAGLGVEGLPQSATGQAALLTGKNVPAILGYHYGPKPNKDVAACLKNGNLFSRLANAGQPTALLNAYPARYFDGIESGHRLPGAIAMAAYQTGLHLMTAEDLYQGNAISADLTGAGWREHLGYPDTPVLTPGQAGRRLAEISKKFKFSLFEYWLTDVAGHNQDMDMACSLLESFDQVIGGLWEAWDEDGLIVLVSDHGNLEDLSTRRHTLNPVPLLLLGPAALRQRFTGNLNSESSLISDITQVYNAVLRIVAPELQV
jgi:2,3-bisphosphoglycerate-independent phosphoglycerate mutase